MSNAILIAEELEALTFPYLKHPHASVVRSAAHALRAGERRQAEYRLLLERLIEAIDEKKTMAEEGRAFLGKEELSIATDARRVLGEQP